MTQDRFEELIGLLLDDDISGDKLDELVEIASADPLKLELLREHLNFSDRLSQYEDELRSEERFQSALQVQTLAMEDTEDFLSQVVSSIQHETAGQSGDGLSQHSQNQDSGWMSYRGLARWVTTVAVVLLLVAGSLIYQVIDRGRDETAQMADEAVAESIDVNDTGVAVLTRVAGLQGSDNGGLARRPNHPAWNDRLGCGAPAVGVLWRSHGCGGRSGGN